MKRLAFDTAIELATWITSNITDLLEQEKLMFQGVRAKEYKQNEGKYVIYVPK